MYSYFSVKNSSQFPAISVYCDEQLLFSDIVSGEQTKFSVCPAGSRCVVILNNRGKVVSDLWLSLSPRKKHILDFVSSTHCSLSPPYS